MKKKKKYCHLSSCNYIQGQWKMLLAFLEIDFSLIFGFCNRHPQILYVSIINTKVVYITNTDRSPLFLSETAQTKE